MLSIIVIWNKCSGTEKRNVLQKTNPGSEHLGSPTLKPAKFLALFWLLVSSPENQDDWKSDTLVAQG